MPKLGYYPLWCRLNGCIRLFRHSGDHCVVVTRVTK